MSRYKKTIIKHQGGLFSGTTYTCYIYDRRKQVEYSGYGDSRKEAEDKCWDNVYLRNDNTTTEDSSSASKGDTDIGVVAQIIFGPVGFWLFGRMIGYFLGALYALGHNVNKIGENATTFSVYCGYILLVPGLIISVILFIDLYKGRT